MKWECEIDIPFIWTWTKILLVPQSISQSNGDGTKKKMRKSHLIFLNFVQVHRSSNGTKQRKHQKNFSYSTRVRMVSRVSQTRPSPQQKLLACRHHHSFIHSWSPQQQKCFVITLAVPHDIRGEATGTLKPAHVLHPVVPSSKFLLSILAASSPWKLMHLHQQ